MLYMINCLICHSCHVRMSSYTGCCWIALLSMVAIAVVGMLAGQIHVKASLTPRADSGRIDSSPTTALSPVDSDIVLHQLFLCAAQFYTKQPQSSLMPLYNNRLSQPSAGFSATARCRRRFSESALTPVFQRKHI